MTNHEKVNAFIYAMWIISATAAVGFGVMRARETEPRWQRVSLAGYWFAIAGLITEAVCWLKFNHLIG